jgi:hypothetical protein
LVKLKKLDHSIFYFGLSGFSGFQNRNRKRAKIEDSKIQGILRHGKLLKDIKEPRLRKSKPKAKATKIGLSDFEYRSIRFSQSR